MQWLVKCFRNLFHRQGEKSVTSLVNFEPVKELTAPPPVDIPVLPDGAVPMTEALWRSAGGKSEAWGAVEPTVPLIVRPLTTYCGQDLLAPKPPVVEVDFSKGTTCYLKIFPVRHAWLYDAIFFIGHYQAALRVTAVYPGAPEEILHTLINPRSGERVMLLGLHDHRAEAPVHLTIESRLPFLLEDGDIWATYKRPAFRREDGMIIFHDKFYEPIPEREFLEPPASPHHRKIYGAGKDIGYR